MLKTNLPDSIYTKPNVTRIKKYSKNTFEALYYCNYVLYTMIFTGNIDKEEVEKAWLLSAKTLRSLGVAKMIEGSEPHISGFLPEQLLRMDDEKLSKLPRELQDYVEQLLEAQENED